MNDPLQQIVIELQCARIATTYARATDLGDGERASACFTEDGELHMPGGRSYRGRKAIAQRIQEQPAEQISRHVLSNILVEIHSATRATGHMYMTMYRGVRSAEAGAVSLDGPYLIGEYEDEYRLTTEGWHLARRRLTTVFRRQDASSKS